MSFGSGSTAMHTQTIASTIATLSGLLAEPKASFDGLAALHTAREQLTATFDAYADELRTSSATAAQWDAIAAAMGVTGSTPSRSCRDQLLVEQFWRDHADRFTWDFLPMELIHELYAAWIARRHRGVTPLSKNAFTRRLRTILPDCGTWRYTRSRPGALMRGTDPLVQSASWCHDGTDDAIYGLRRRGA